jgi:predicted PurR-regulated permease PerM
MSTAPSQISVTITTATIIRALLVVLACLAVYVFWDLVLIILTSVVIASSIEPATRWFGRHSVARVPAVLIVYVTALLLFAGLFYAIIPPFLEDALNLLRSLPEYLGPSFLGDTAWPGFIDGVQELPEHASLVDILSSFRDLASGTSSGGFLAVLGIISGGILSAVLIIVLSFYLSVQHDGVGDFLRIVTPASYENYVIDLWRRSQYKIGRWMQGQLLLAIVVGLLVYVGLLVLGVRYALLLAISAALFEIIPFFGPILASIPAITISFTESGFVAAVVVAGLYTIIQQVENHFLYPYVVRKVVGVPALLVIIGVLVGAKLAGFLGILLSVPVAAVVHELIGDLEKKKRQGSIMA